MRIPNLAKSNSFFALLDISFNSFIVPGLYLLGALKSITADPDTLTLVIIVPTTPLSQFSLNDN